MYEQLVTQMEERYTQLAGVAPADATDIGVRIKVLAGELAQLYGQVEELSHQVFPQHSSGAYLELHGQMRGLTRKPATAATGMLRFSRTTPAGADLPIPKGTMGATSTTPQRYVTTTEGGILPEGALWVDLPAKTSLLGSEGNLATGMVGVLVSTPVGVARVTNPVPFTGGRDAECDVTFRQRLLASFGASPTGANVGYYYNLAMADHQVVQCKVLPRRRGRGMVDVVLTTCDSGQGAETAKRLGITLGQQKEIGVDVQVLVAKEQIQPITVSLAIAQGHTFATVAEGCQREIAGFFEQLGIGEGLRLSHLGRGLLEVEGLENYKFALPLGDVLPVVDGRVRSGEVRLTEWGS